MRRVQKGAYRQTYCHCRGPTGSGDDDSKPMGWPITQNKSVKCMDAHGNDEEE
jgi:hypothetical protein